MKRISRRDLLAAATAAAAAAFQPHRLWAQPAAPGAAADLPRPSPAQAAWQDLELGTFFHFDITTMARYDKRTDLMGHIDPDVYNPAALDCDQWMEAVKSMGARYAVFTACHGGFLQWPSDAYPYGVKESSWRRSRGDTVREFVEACRRHGIKPGIYCHVIYNGYLRVHQGRPNWGAGGSAEEQQRYNRIVERRLEELWSRYGELVEVWFDGGALPLDQGGPDIKPLLDKYQPNAVVFQTDYATIRWVGNEAGYAGYPCWSTVTDRRRVMHDSRLRTHGDPQGKVWMPAECDVPLPGHSWNWDPNKARIKPADTLPKLMDMYYRSVGRNANLLLNCTPNNLGVVDDFNMVHYVEFGKEIRRRFGKPLGETSGNGSEITLAFKQPDKIDHVIIMEDIVQGEHIREYIVEGLVPGNTWKELCRGVSVGHKRIEQFPPQEVAQVRLRVTQQAATPRIRQFAAYNVADT